MLWRHVLRALIFPVCCFVLNAWLFLSAMAPVPMRPPAVVWAALAFAVLALVCAFIIAAFPAGVALIAWFDRRARAGRISVLGAFRGTYFLARALNTGIAIGLLIGCLGPFVLFSLGGPGMLLGAVVCVLQIAWLMAGRLRTSAPDDDDSACVLWGKAVALDAMPSMKAFIEPIALRFRAPLPHQVVIGFEPGVHYIAQDVLLDDTRYEGGTIVVSLPMLRLIDRGEFAGLAAFTLWPEGVVGAAERRFIGDARSRVAALLEAQRQSSIFRVAFGAAHLPLQVWTDIWAGLEFALLQGAAQGAAVVAGRETTGAALARQLLYAKAWWPFVVDSHRAAREPGFQTSEPEQPGRQFECRLRELLDDPATLRPFESPESFRETQPGLAVLVSGLGIAPADIAARMRAAPLDSAAELLGATDTVERDLGRQFFEKLRPEWPRQPEMAGRASGDGVDTDGEALQPHLAQAIPSPRSGSGSPPLFTGVGSRGRTEGFVVAAIAILAMLWLVSTPYLPRFALWLDSGWDSYSQAKAPPLTMVIGEYQVAFSNQSDGRLDCAVEAGPSAVSAFTATFLVDAHETRHLAYQEFRGRDHVSDAAVRRAADAGGLVTCVDSSGVSRVLKW